MTLATSVKFLIDLSLGNSWIRPHKLGDRIAGHKQRRNMQELNKLSVMSGRFTSAHRLRTA